MIEKVDGIAFKNMVEYALGNLNTHLETVNKLNVFPVPDGDTGTNMVTTIHKGLMALDDDIKDLQSISKKFARSIVFEARGNSGVIVSQFLKGIAEKFYNSEAIDSALFIEALESGVKYAYSSVLTPVEGTMLTVIKDATNAVKKEFDGSQSVDDVVASFVKNARISLNNTPELLPVLKENGVVDSGGAGIVYMFEGIEKYFNGESIGQSVEKTKEKTINYDAFDRHSIFEYGYCTELLLQLLENRQTFFLETFKEELTLLGNSLVVTQEGDKVRIHIHTSYPEKVFALCHNFGEFLTLKVENMTVQHTELNKGILLAPTKSNSAFGVVAVAFDQSTQNLFIEMGADAVIYSDNGVSIKDYLDAFDKLDYKEIFVFPNSSDAILSCVQAKNLYKKANVTVINSKNIASCYASLPAIDFTEKDTIKAEEEINGIIDNLYIVSVAQRKEAESSRNINQYEYYSYCGKELMVVSKTLNDAAIKTIKNAIEQFNKEIITIFYRSHVSKSVLNDIIESINSLGYCAEIFTVETNSLPCEMTISFE